MISTLDQSRPPFDEALAAAPKSRAVRQDSFGWLRTFSFSALAASLLCWVGFYNGYPVVTPDSGAYLRTAAFQIALWPYRAPGYSDFIGWTMLGTSTWFTIAAQAIVVVYMLRKTLAYLVGGETEYLDRCLLAATCTLGALTSLPWTVSELMPDAFAGVLLLSAFLLAFAREDLVERTVLALISALAIASHASLLPIAALYAVALIALRLADHRAGGRPPLRFVVIWLVAPIVAAGWWTAAQNQKMGVGFSVSPTKNYFLLGTLFGDGIARDFLVESCPKRAFISCRFLDHLPQSDSEFMWEHPLRPALYGHDDEVEAIVRGAILAYPGRFLVSTVRGTLQQSVAFRTAGDTRLTGLSDRYYDKNVRMVIPKESEPFRRSRQFLDRLFPLSGALAPIHEGAFWLSMVACLLFAWIGRFEPINKLLASTVAFLFINAAVCGGLSGVFYRYQSRVAWTIPFCLVVYVCCAIGDWKRKRPAS